jgi:hypoxanthine phosphoribosyltransferase
MNRKIRLKDRDFELYIPEAEIVAAITRMAEDMERDMRGEHPLFVGVLNGAYMFVAELMSKMSLAHELTFAAYASYDGLQSNGIVQELLPVRGDLRDRPVVLLEDVVDTGLTMQYVMKRVRESTGACDVRLATMLLKPDALQCDLKPDYTGLVIENDFVVGFGLDYDGVGRALRHIYRIRK